MIEALISSKTRIKLLLKFFLNGDTSSYLRELASEFGESSNGVRVELNRFEKGGLLLSNSRGNKKYYQANPDHPLFLEIHNIVLKYVGIDQVVDQVVSRLGNLHQLYLTGDFAEGKDSSVIDLIFVGHIDDVYLLNLIKKTEELVKRKIRFLVYKSPEDKALVQELLNQKILLLWEK